MVCWAMEKAYDLHGKIRVKMASDPDSTCFKSPSMPVPRNLRTASLRVQMAEKSASGVPEANRTEILSPANEQYKGPSGVPGGSNGASRVRGGSKEAAEAAAVAVAIAACSVAFMVRAMRAAEGERNDSISTPMGASEIATKMAFFVWEILKWISGRASRNGLPCAV